MKCNQALDALATGGFVQRWLAARHLARCPNCSEQAQALGQIVDALSDVPPLTESERRSWMKAAEVESAIPVGPRIPIFDRVAIAASLLLACVFLWSIRTYQSDRPRPPIVVAIDPVVIKQATLRDLDTLQGKTSTLSRDLDDLLREVDLLDARRDVEALQLQFASLGVRAGN
jgi:hypothetical protein